MHSSILTSMHWRVITNFLLILSVTLDNSSMDSAAITPWPVIGGVIGGLVTLVLALLILLFISFAVVVKLSKRDTGDVQEDGDRQREDVGNVLEMKANEAYASVICHENTHMEEDTTIVRNEAYSQITQNSINCLPHEDVVYCEIK